MYERNDSVPTFLVPLTYHPPMKHHLLLPVVTGLLLLAIPAMAVTVPIGDTLPLSGSAPGVDTVYLYLTGPNLPTNGVKLDDISVPAVTGVPSTFARAPVDADGNWEYTWYTRTAGGTLDAGTYTVYVVTEPAGRRDIGSADAYATIPVTLARPTLTIFPGGITISSEPSGAEVLVDGTPAGTTPLTLDNVTEGGHVVEVRKEGYEPIVENVTVTGGENATVETVLLPGTTPGIPAETPQGTFPVTPTRIAFPAGALLLGLAVLVLLQRDR
jgi:hypothetical protein